MTMKMMTVVLVALLAVQAVVAVDHTVGGSDRWESGVDYEAWAAGKTFNVGDTLVFTYGLSHTVDVVTKAGYDNCDASTATSTFTNGNTKIELKTAGPQYFICATAGHCLSGMKLTVVVKAQTATPTPTPSTPSTPSTPPPSTGGSKTPPPTTGGSATPPTTDNTPDVGSTPSPPPPSAAAATAGSMGFLSYGLMTLVLGFVVC